MYVVTVARRHRAGAKAHIEGRNGKPLCSAGRRSKLAPYPGLPKPQDICATCAAINDGAHWVSLRKRWRYPEPKLSKLMGEA